MRTPFVDKSPHRRDSAAGRLKQRLARILTRSTCTTNNAAAASSGGTATATAFVSLAKTNNAHTAASSSHPEPEAPPSPYFCTPCTYDYERPKADRGTRPRRSRTRTRSASLVHISVDCTGGAASGRRSAHSDAPLLQHLLSEQVPARDVVGGTKQSKGGGGRSKLTTARSSPSASRRHCSSSSSSWGRARARRPSSTPTPYSWSSSRSSATATDDELAPFSGTDDEAGGEAADMRTLFSSLSFSSDPTSSEFYRTNGARSGNANRRSHRNTASRRRRRARAPRRALSSRAGGGDPAAPPDAFRPLVSVETTRRTTERSERTNEDKGLNNAKKLTMTMLGAAAAAEEEAAGAGMAVVKRSSNPYLDFRSSMVEMVVERRIASVGKMEELLGSYLSLNSPRHHPAILAAFEDVWEAVFGEE
ncbi:Transcription repressor OFP7 [Zea mays]|uniref:Transcription repressor n=1 Tax=Zea mays TaxID=4577 RepID=A0A3L6F9X5_MAIZE|nr:Transcription repressor OFP7 [Zea mays]